MGQCESICLPPKNIKIRSEDKTSLVYPNQFKSSKLAPSEKNNKKFCYLENEDTIDTSIIKLDELLGMNENEEKLLRHTIAKLKKLAKGLNRKFSHGTTDDIKAISGMVLSYNENNLLEESFDSNYRFKKRNSVDNFSNVMFFRQNDIRDGTLTVEIMKGIFLHKRMIKKHKLTAPYVTLRLYLNKTDNTSLDAIHSYTEVRSFETLKNESPGNPEWAELFEHVFADENRLAFYVIGISLHYLNDKDEKVWQIGEEEFFSLGSLLDQGVQNKEIEYKDPISKGVLAKLKIRFQFIYDLEEVKDKLYRDINTRIERLYRIRERFQAFPEKSQRERGDSKFAQSSNSSIASTSSNHENDSKYFVVTQ